MGLVVAVRRWQCGIVVVVVAMAVWGFFSRVGGCGVTKMKIEERVVVVAVTTIKGLGIFLRCRIEGRMVVVRWCLVGVGDGDGWLVAVMVAAPTAHRCSSSATSE